MDNGLILEVKNLQTHFATEGKIKKVVDDLSFSIKKGKVMGLVGISGTGKSVVGMSILNLVSKPGRIVGGEVLFKGKDLLKTNERDLQKIRGSDLALVSQDPYTSMDPLYTVGNQLVEVIQAHEAVSKKETKEKAIRLLTIVGIPDPERRMLNFPHQFSGGMQQRIVIAMAIASNPSLIIMDDPTRSLDVTIQAQILSVLSQLQTRFNTTMLLISASVQVVAQFADDVMTIFRGRCMEVGPKQSVFKTPCHPYTRSLFDAVPSMEGERVSRLKGLDALHQENGPGSCVFYTYCNKAQKKCAEVPPVLVQVGEDHFCACHF